MKRKKNTCHALEFAKQVYTDKPWIHDLKDCDEEFRRSYKRLKDKGFVRDVGETGTLSRTMFTINRWFGSKQCYSITKALAEDLFAMNDLSFPMDAMRLPFPCFYLDMESFGEDFSDVPGAKLLGYYVMVDEVPYGKGTVASCCSIVILALSGDGEYIYGGAAFDYAPEHMEMDLNGTVSKLSQDIPEQKKHIVRALLLAAYLSSEKPDVTENETHKQIYRPSSKSRYSSVRKWDAGIRYMREKQKHMESLALGASTDEDPDSTLRDDTAAADGKAKRNPPRPHLRKAHWQTYRIGHKRMGKKVLWIPPVMVGMPRNWRQEGIPAVIRRREGERI